MTTETISLNLTRKDFVSDQEVRWCPGCGDYAILAQMQKVMPELGIPKENIVFISGIGCSSRFPYYMDTYGIHSIHGRAPTLAAGLAIANPDLSIWVITGDGDGLSIGGNHLVHALRRNINLNIILFNNRIYGLTKGQFSPTSRQGSKTKSSPMGSIEQPLNPLSVALSAEATFVARSMDSNVKHLAETLSAAAAHKGTSFVEVFQNCVIFNPTEWDFLGDRATRDENILFLENGKPMIFGKNSDKGIAIGKDFQPQVVDLGNGTREEDLLVHNPTTDSSHLAYLLSRMDFPTPMGVFRNVQRPTYGEGLLSQVATAREKRGPGDLNQLFRTADLWEVKASEEVQSQISGQMSSELSEAYVDEIDQEQPEPAALQESLESEPISSLKLKAPISVEQQTSLANAIQLMNSHEIGALLITDESGRLVGILTEHDVLTKVACQVEDLTQARVVNFMTRDPFALQVDTPIKYALHLMSSHGFRHLPLVDNDKRPDGIISFRDVVRHLKKDLA